MAIGNFLRISDSGELDIKVYAHFLSFEIRSHKVDAETVRVIAQMCDDGV